MDESAANLEVAEAKLALAEATAQRLRIVAPFDGVAGIRGVNVGDYLKDGADIVNVEDLDAVYVDFRLPERLQNKVKTGQTARVAFDALPGVQYSAVVLAINPQIDADGRSLAVRGCIDNRRLQLRPGMFARVTAVFGERSDANVVPEEAIVPDGAAPYVLRWWLARKRGSQVARAPRAAGRTHPGFVEVVEGLVAGMWWSRRGSSACSAMAWRCAWWSWASLLPGALPQARNLLPRHLPLRPSQYRVRPRQPPQPLCPFAGRQPVPESAERHHAADAGARRPVFLSSAFLTLPDARHATC